MNILAGSRTLGQALQGEEKKWGADRKCACAKQDRSQDGEDDQDTHGDDTSPPSGVRYFVFELRQLSSCVGEVFR